MRLCCTMIFAAILATMGYAQSIQPFYEAGNVIFKPELVGKWTLEGVTLEFRDIGNQTYGVKLFGDDGFVLHFRAHLIRIGSNYFLDGQVSGVQFSSELAKDSIGASTPKGSLNQGFELDEDDVFLNRHHGLILVDFTKDADEFIGHLWNKNWLPRMAEKKNLKCTFIKDEKGRILLTGDSRQLRSFVERLPIEAFEDGYKLTRFKEEKVAHPKTSRDDAFGNLSCESGKDMSSVKPIGVQNGQNRVLRELSFPVRVSMP